MQDTSSAGGCARSPGSPGPDDTRKPVISDNDLWRLVGWEPTSPAERARILFPGSGVGFAASHEVDDRPDQAWIDWAKAEILSGPGKRPPDDAYVCRLLRVMEMGGSGESWKEELQAAVVSGLMVCSEGSPHTGRFSYLASQAIRAAVSSGLVEERQVDTWRPGMVSGSGIRTIVRLTMAGRLLAARASDEPPVRGGAEAACGEDQGSDEAAGPSDIAEADAEAPVEPRPAPTAEPETPVTLLDFIQQYCEGGETLASGTLDSRRNSLQSAARAGTLQLPEHVGAWRPGKRKYYLPSALSSAWPEYCRHLPNLPLLRRQ